MWTVGLLEYSFRERVDAIARQGCTAMSAMLGEMEDFLAGGEANALRQCRAYAEDHGVRLEILEPVLAWLPDTALGTLRRVELDKISLIGTEFGVRSMLAIANRGTGLGEDALAEKFAELRA